MLLRALVKLAGRSKLTPLTPEQMRDGLLSAGHIPPDTGLEEAYQRMALIQWNYCNGKTESQIKSLLRRGKRNQS